MMFFSKVLSTFLFILAKESDTWFGVPVLKEINLE